MKLIANISLWHRQCAPASTMTGSYSYTQPAVGNGKRNEDLFGKNKTRRKHC